MDQPGRITRDLLQRFDHSSVQAQDKDLRDLVKAWNENPKPFILDRDRRPDNSSDDYCD